VQERCKLFLPRDHPLPIEPEMVWRVASLLPTNGPGAGSWHLDEDVAPLPAYVSVPLFLTASKQCYLYI